MDVVVVQLRLWQVDLGLLENACYMVTINLGRGRTKSVPCNKGGREGGMVLRDTLARMVYDQLFVWIVEQCSAKLKVGRGVDDLFLGEFTHELASLGNHCGVLGVLDIFGFEFYENHQIKPLDQQVVNGLDQLNINICNEVLQQQFVKVSFHMCKFCLSSEFL